MAQLTRLLVLASLLAAPLAGGCKPRTALGNPDPGEPARGSLQAGVVHELKTPEGATVLAFPSKPADRRVIVYLHGKCVSARPDLEAVGTAMAAHGHVVAPIGSEACPNGQTMWTSDPLQLDQQVRSAVATVERASGLSFDHEDQILVGYSQGADRGEALAAQQPRFKRLVLIGSPEAPAAGSFLHATAVALLAGSLDRQDLMKAGERSLEAAGKPVEFLVLPGAEHGAFGPEGPRVMGEALSFVLTPPRG